jgi:hypothetical protein
VNGSVAWFGLRTNAQQLIQGAGARAVRRRIKRASLINDKVLLQSGTYRLLATTSRAEASFSDVPSKLQSPRDRDVSRMRPIDFSECGCDEDVEDVAFLWTATLEFLREELPSDANWIEFAPGRIGPDAIHAAFEMARRDIDHPVPASMWPARGVRERVLRDTALDIASSARDHQELNLDRLHMKLLRPYLDRGDAYPLFADRVLRLIDPVELSWSDIADLRSHPGIREYRAVLRDVQQEASFGSASELDLRLVLSYSDALARAEARQPSLRTHVATTMIGFLVGELTGEALGVPMVGGATGAVIGEVAATAAHRAAKPRWLAVHERLDRVPRSLDGWQREGRLRRTTN